MPDFSIENLYRDFVIIGVDEAGRGPLCGAVVSAAVILDKNNYPQKINDSKKLSPKIREQIFDELQSVAKIGVGIVDNDKIDEINILQATKLSMKFAVENLISKLPKNQKYFVIVDGNQKFDAGEIQVLPVVKGDGKSLSIAAASIIAKVTRDKILHKMHLEFPQYNWLKNAGYGTAQHIEAIKNYGITKYHRKTFEPIKSMLK
jgi:ribonuclease HII